MSAYDQLVKNNAAAIAAARTAEAVPVKPATTAAEFLGLPFKPGDRVLDRQTGAVGVVLDATVKNSVQPQTPAEGAAAAPSFLQLPKLVQWTVVTVQLDDGETIERAPVDLVDVPPGLTVDLSSLGPL